MKTGKGRNSKTRKFVGQNPAKGSTWSGLSKRKTVDIERNLRGVLKEQKGTYLAIELERYKGIRIIED